MKYFAQVCAVALIAIAATGCSHHGSGSGNLRLGSVEVNAKDGAAMVYVPAGAFTMGADAADLKGTAKYRMANAPRHTVQLNSYWIYKTPVTVAQFRAYCKFAKRPMPPAPPGGWRSDDPVVNVSWNDAAAYARWAHAVLPTEAQWEKAARGNDGRAYPWGNAWNPGLCAHSKSQDGDLGGPTAVGSFPAGASPSGALDMAGDVWQWCSDWYGSDYYKNSPAANPTGPPTGQYRVLRGGAWDYTDPTVFRTDYRFYYYPSTVNVLVGFRCAVNASAR